MYTKIVAFLMGILSIFAVWNWEGQPNRIPEARTPPFEGALAPDKYGVWPTEEFTKGKKPWWLILFPNKTIDERTKMWYNKRG